MMTYCRVRGVHPPKSHDATFHLSFLRYLPFPFPSLRSSTPSNPVRICLEERCELPQWGTILIISPNFLIFDPPRISVTHFASPGVPHCCPWVGLTHGLGWVGSGSRIFVFSGLGWVVCLKWQICENQMSCTLHTRM